MECEYFNGSTFLEVKDLINAFLTATGATGVSLAIQLNGLRCEAILLYTP